MHDNFFLFLFGISITEENIGGKDSQDKATLLLFLYFFKNGS
jgi:hypothetical protein